MRSEFEKLPEITEIIKENGAFYCDKGEWYLCPDDQFAESYLDGAWYAFQEQQKKIDSAEHIRKSILWHIENAELSGINNDYDQGWYDCLKMLYKLTEKRE